ncbi:uncharacterized protein A1O9_04490, partial [Exophiala aquamarina CBS 119918]
GARGDEEILGATIFFAYIAAALLLTGFLTWDLAITYRIRRKSSHPLHGNGSEYQVQSKLQGSNSVKIRTGGVLAAFSFATLSYHMLHFLTQSHRRWWNLKQGLWSVEDVGLTHPHIWQWTKESALFEDFAQAIRGEPHRFWWTHLVLVYSFAWNLFM